MNKIMILAGSTNRPLAQKIFDEISLLDTTELGMDLLKREITIFPDGEIGVELNETVAGAEVFIVQTSITGKVNNNFVETLFLADAAKRARAKAVFLVQLILPYQRQDRRESNKNHRPKRKSVSAKVILDCYTKAVGVKRIIAVKLHSEQIEGFVDNDASIENIDPTILFKNFLESSGVIKKTYEGKEPIVVAPDVGAAKSVEDFHKALNLSTYAIINKRRSGPGQSEALHLIGDCEDRDCIIYDDLIDTGNTVIKAAEKLKEFGAKNIYLVAPHGVFSEGAVEKLANAPFEKIVITDSIPNPEIDKYSEKFVVLSLATILAKVIINIHNPESFQPVLGRENGISEREGVIR